MATISATVDLELMLQQVATPPAEATVIPISVKAPYSMTVSSDAKSSVGSRAVVTLRVAGGFVAGNLLQEQVTAGGGTDSASRDGVFHWRGTLGNDADNPWASSLRFSINAFCRSSMNIGYGGNDVSYATDCQSIIDPLFFFDQEEFDSLMGENTFRLSEFLELGLPENLGEPPTVVPLPGTVWLFGTALLSLGLRLPQAMPRLKQKPTGILMRFSWK